MNVLRELWDYATEPTKAETARRQNHYAHFQEYGFPEAVSRHLAFNCLRDWSEPEVQRVLGQVQVGSGHLSQLQIVNRHDETRLTRPSDELISNAATTRKALCINKSYEFQLREDGYMAISHVWAEGLYADAHNKGLPSSIIDQIFLLLKDVKGVEWLWLDSLAVPGGIQELDAGTQMIKTKLINNMAKIYRNADAVIVLDALLVHLHSQSPEDVAMALLCGKWFRRMWTFQESRLALKVIVITGQGPVDLQSVIKDLSRPDRRAMVWIVSQLRAIFNPRKDVNLLELSEACYLREAKVDIDHIRALYPVLSLPWEQKFDYNTAMENVYRARPSETPQLAWTWGSPRLRGFPGWAPAYLSGLDSHELKGAKLGAEGLEVPLYQYPIQYVGRDLDDQSILRIDFTEEDSDDDSLECLAQLSPRELNDDVVLGKLIDVVKNGNGMLLAHKPLPSMFALNKATQYRIVVLAGVTKRNPAHFDVYITVKLLCLELGLSGTKALCVLNNISPLKRDSTNNDLEGMQGLLTTSTAMANSGGTKLHEAVKKTNEKRVKYLLKAGADPNAEDAKGWCPLHWAMFASPESSLRMVELLVHHGATPFGGGPRTKTPATLAAERGCDDVVKYLIRQRADHQPRQGITPLVQALYSQRNSPIILHLIDTGADLLEFVHGRPPLFYALSNQEALRMLLRHGADPTARLTDGRSLLQAAARDDNSPAIMELLQAGAPIDMKQVGGSGCTALHDAVLNQSLSCVNTLLALSADPNQECDDGQTALHYAIAQNNKEIVSSLLNRHANVSSVTKTSRQTALHVAVCYERSEILVMLLEAPDSANAMWQRDAEGFTPYMRAQTKIESGDWRAMTLLLARRIEEMSKLYITTFIFIYFEGFCFITWQFLVLYRSCTSYIWVPLSQQTTSSSLEIFQPCVQALGLVIAATTTMVWFHRAIPFSIIQTLLNQTQTTRWQNKARSRPPGNEASLIFRCAVIYILLPLYYYLSLQARYGTSVAGNTARLLLTEMPLYYALEGFLGWPRSRAYLKTSLILTIIWGGDTLVKLSYDIGEVIERTNFSMLVAAVADKLGRVPSYEELAAYAELMPLCLLACGMTALVDFPNLASPSAGTGGVLATFLRLFGLLVGAWMYGLDDYPVNVLISLALMCYINLQADSGRRRHGRAKSDERDDPRAGRAREIRLWVCVALPQLLLTWLAGSMAAYLNSLAFVVIAVAMSRRAALDNALESEDGSGLVQIAHHVGHFLLWIPDKIGHLSL
ncbi:MAG: hypothetical protein Q9160_001581 [Pyrenula sp. 1 TL-2023]